ncbi:MAG: hypothetical protein KIT22_02000 [Verrucomicrobiae bacterium]|nr:hypothetical protein [Verrucomicrobiae bacterium]
MAYLFGTIRTPDRAAFEGRVGLMPVSMAPVGHGMETVGWAPVLVATNEDGFFTVQIAAGDYWLHIGNALRRLITLPDDTRYYLLQDLLGDGVWGVLPQNYRETPGGMQFINGTTGAYHALALAGTEEEVGWRIYAAREVLPPDSYKVVTGTAFFRVSPSGGWHAPFLTGPGDNPVMSFAEADEQIEGGNFRISGGLWQFRNITTGQFHTFFLIGAVGEESWAIGPGITP